MIDRLIAIIFGLVCGAVMAGLWSLIALRGIGACYVEHLSLPATFACALAKAGFWLLLLLPPLIGLVFGIDTMLHYLSKFWGTHKDTATYIQLKKPATEVKRKYKIFENKDINHLLSPLIKISEHSFTIMRKTHKWSEISNINIWQEPYPAYGLAYDSTRIPFIEIELNTGKTILINGNCIEKKYDEVAPSYLSAFEELAHEFKKRYEKAIKCEAATTNHSP